jgi:hypothetical protein
MRAVQTCLMPGLSFKPWFKALSCLKNGRLSALVLIAGALCVGVACSPQKEVQLQPPPSSPGAPLGQEGGQEGTDSDQGQPQDSDNQGGTQPPPSPTATPSPLPRYRAFCDDRYPSYITAISSLAGASGFGAALALGLPSSPGGPVDRSRLGLEDHTAPVLVSWVKTNEARLVFAATRMSTGSSLGKSRGIFMADADLVYRVGEAREVADEPNWPGELSQWAENEGATVRAFGRSDRGRFAIFPITQSGRIQAWRIWDHQNSSEWMRVSSTAHAFGPELRDSDGVFLFSDLAGGRVRTHIVQLDLKARRELSRSSVSALRRPLQFLSQRAGHELGGMNAQNQWLIVPPLQPSQLKAEALVGRWPGRVSSAFAMWKDVASGEIFAATASEDFSTQTDIMGTKIQVREAWLRVLRRGPSGRGGIAWSVVEDVSYPQDVVKALELYSSFDRRPGLWDLQVTGDDEAAPRALFATLPADFGRRVYRWTAQGVLPMSQERCRYMHIGVEP